MLAAQKPTISGAAPKAAWHRGEGGDCPPLLRSHEAPPGALNSALGSTAQEGHETVRTSPEESHRDDR